MTASPATMLARADVQSFITRTNWYAVWSYLYNYVGNELSGSLAQLDPNTGLTPQNNGLFTKMTVSQMLFGQYTVSTTPLTHAHTLFASACC
jgi:hypothetical protein